MTGSWTYIFTFYCAELEMVVIVCIYKYITVFDSHTARGFIITQPIICWLEIELLNSLSPRQNGRHFADDIFKCIFLNENIWIPIKISLKFVPKGPINNIPALVQIMAWRWPGDKPLSQPMMVSLPMHICVTRPQWVKFMWFKCYHAIFP